MSSKTTFRKICTSRGVLTNIEEVALCTYIEKMADCGLPLFPTIIKIKVG